MIDAFWGFNSTADGLFFHLGQLEIKNLALWLHDFPSLIYYSGHLGFLWIMRSISSVEVVRFHHLRLFILIINKRSDSTGTRS